MTEAVNLICSDGWCESKCFRSNRRRGKILFESFLAEGVRPDFERNPGRNRETKEENRTKKIIMNHDEKLPL